MRPIHPEHSDAGEDHEEEINPENNMEAENKVNIEVVNIDDLIQDDHNFNI